MTSSTHSQDVDRSRSRLLKACLFATGCAGIVAEFVLSTLASYLLGNSTLQWTLVMSLMLFAMGVGSRLSRHIYDRLLDRFIAVEFTLSVLCATSGAAAYFGTAVTGQSAAVIYGYAFAIGMLIGMEIPLVARLNESYEALRTNLSGVMEKDYYGALLGGLLFAFLALPHLGLTYTPIVLGAVNFIVASALLWKFRGRTVRPGRLTTGFAAVGLTLAALAVLIKPIVLFAEQSRYRDRIVFSEQTPYQQIVMTEWKGHHWLYLNGSVQFSTYDEERYHEPLVHPAMQLAVDPRHVLILGGGDGLALREVVKYPAVDRVTLVDLDPAMTALASEHPVLVRANDDAFTDTRVRVVHADGGTFLDASEDIYDVIIVDLPDPKGPDLARLYSREFYRSCERHLSETGVLVTQSSSPLHANRAFVCVYRTMQDAGFSVLPYHNALSTMGVWGWNLGVSREQMSPEALRRRASALTFETVPTVFLNREAMQGMMHFWKGMFDAEEAVAVNTVMEPVIDTYYREAEWGW